MTAPPPERSVPIAPGTLVDGRLLIDRALGAGGMGEVFLAHGKTLPDVQFAVKVLRKEYAENAKIVRRLEDEARTQSVFKHDNIVRVFELLSWAGHTCLVMEYVEGESLERRIAQQPDGLGEAEVLNLMVGILKGLNHAHEHAVLHCDVKPGNVLLDAEGRPRITDFGISRDFGLVTEGFVKGGSPAYMSPEQVTRPNTLDLRTDVYSSGVLMFEMLTGRLPFPESDEDPFPQVKGTPLKLRALSPQLDVELEAIVAKALQADRALRYQGCLDFLSAIEARLARKRLRERWLPALAVVAVAAVVVPAAVYWYRHKAEQEAEQRIREARELALRQQSATIAAATKNAVDNLFSICRDSVRLKNKQAGLETARRQGETDLVPKFQDQLKQIEQNLGDFASAYGTAVGSLAKFDRKFVTEQMPVVVQLPAADGWLLKAVERDLAANRTAGTWKDLLTQCKA